MSDTPYFDAYEARRRARTLNPLYTIDNASRTFIGSGTVFTIDDSNITSCNTEGTVLTHSSGIDSWYTTTGSNYITSDYITSEVYPKYRLQKTYTFIEDVRVVQDCFIESKANFQAEWVQVDESFNAYSFV
jgi:hypothetical protein